MGLLVATVVAGGLGGLGVAPAGAASVRVSQGETLSELAARYHTTVAALAAGNGIRDPNRVVAGQVLQIPGPAPATTAGATPGTVVVAPGESLWTISERTGVTVAALAAANGIRDPNRVQAGQVLRVPAGSGSPGGTAGPGGMVLASATAPLPSGGSSRLPAQLRSSPPRLALRPVFAHFAAAWGVPANLLEGMCWWESGWQSTIVSSTGAIGIGQLEPSTVTFVEQDLLGGARLDPRVPSQNIEMAAAYLHWLLARAGGSESRALAGYYQGAASVAAHGMYPETKLYVTGILATSALFAG